MLPNGNPFNIEQNACFAVYVCLDTRRGLVWIGLQAGYEPLSVILLRTFGSLAQNIYVVRGTQFRQPVTQYNTEPSTRG
jgi:hypothetical protein